MYHLSPLRARAQELYLKGWRDIDIAAELGISRERVRQFRSGRNMTTGAFPARAWVSVPSAARSLKLNTNTLYEWIARDLLETSPSNLVRLSSVKETKDKLLARLCDNCGKGLRSIDLHRRWCNKCGAERERYQYPFMSEAQKKVHAQATTSWARRHPEQLRLFQRRANLVYRLVHEKGLSRKAARKIALDKFPV